MISTMGYVVKKNEFMEKQINNVKDELTVKPNTLFNETASFELFRELGDELIVPRYYGIKKFGNVGLETFEGRPKIGIKFKGRLREYQEEVAKSALNVFEKQGGGIMSLYCGAGKTTLTLYLISQLQAKTLIVVHKSFLQDQWYERIKQFTNARIGFIRQNKVDVKNKDIVIAMLHSISMKDYDQSIFDDFNFVCYDECFVGDTIVDTNAGGIRIDKLWDLWNTGNAHTVKIKSYNICTGKFEYRNLVYAWRKLIQAVSDVDFGGFKVRCTPNHRFLTLTGYKEARMLIEGDVFIGIKCGEYFEHRFCGFIPIEEESIVYDIEVECNHNFIVCSSNIGIVVHNCHHSPARVFSKSLMKVNARYTLGLSATPIRHDGLTKVMNWFLGDIFVTLKRNYESKIFVRMFHYESRDPLFVEKRRYIKGKIVPDIQAMITKMYEMKERNIFVAKIISELRRKEGRKILVLSGRIEHLKQLKKLVDDELTLDVMNGNCEEGEVKTAFYIGKMKDYQLKDAAEADIIFGSFTLAEEGLDIDGLNTLVMATPKKDIVQSIGRIIRKPADSISVCPLIVDISDMLSKFSDWGSDRKRYYTKEGYDFSEYQAIGVNCVGMKDYLLSKKIINQFDIDIEDIRKKFILSRYCEDYYELEKEADFVSFPNCRFDYDSSLSKILDTDSNPDCDLVSD